MIYLLWAAIVLQGCITVWLARRVWQLDGLVATVALICAKALTDQSGLNITVAKKLRNLGQPID